jgi:enolase
MIDLDGTPNKGRLGANAILGVSLATAHAAAASRREPLYAYLAELCPWTGGRPGPLPIPMFNILNCGKHGRHDSPEFQEFMVMPIGATTFREALRMGAEVYHALHKTLLEKGNVTTLGHEGGFSPKLKDNDAAIQMVYEAIGLTSYRQEMALALDPAVSEIYKDGRYFIKKGRRQYSSSEMIEQWERWCKKYPIVSIEDGMAEDDWEGWRILNERLGSKVQLVGDDLFVTNVDRIERGVAERSANAVLIKPNQIGSLTETLSAISAAREANWNYIISHRSGETEDTTIADLAVATHAGQIKTGAPARGERTAKYNRLLRIEEELGPLAEYPQNLLLRR